MKRIALLIVVLAIVGGFFYYRNFLVPQDADRIENINRDTKIEQGNVGGEEKTEQGDAVIAQEFSKEAFSVFYEDVEIQRFWFPKDESFDFAQSGVDKNPIFYVEYVNNKGNQRKVLIRKMGQDSYKILATFLPGRNEWELETGNDILFGQELKLYESR